MQAIWHASWIELFLNYLPCGHWESTNRTMRTASIYYIRVIRVKTDILWVSSLCTVADPRDHFSKPYGLSSPRWHLFFIWNTLRLSNNFQISWRSLYSFGFAGYKVTCIFMTYFERSLYHRNRLNCLRHNKVRSVWGLKKSLYKRSSCTTLVRSCSHVAGTVGGGRGSEDGHLTSNTRSLLENSQSERACYCSHIIKKHILLSGILLTCKCLTHSTRRTGLLSPKNCDILTL